MKHYQVLMNRKAGFYKIRDSFGEWINEYRGDYTQIVWITFKGELIK
jgi:hypothetical protein